MNCDMAFEHLTDPNRRDRDELQRHLAACPRCRQMKETLEPAFDLLDAAAGHDESDRSLTHSLVDQDDWRIGEAQSEPLRLSGEAVRLQAWTCVRFLRVGAYLELKIMKLAVTMKL